MFEPNKSLNQAEICGWGSGFMFKHKDKNFFVTCDHTLHMEDHDLGERTGEDYQVCVISNIKDPNRPMEMKILPLSGFYYFDKFSINEQGYDFDLEDVAFAEIKESLPMPLLTHQLNDYDQAKVLVKAGLSKLYINEGSIAKPNAAKEYVITGCVKNKIVNDIKMQRENAFYEGIKYSNSKFDNFDVYLNPTICEAEKWAGLSGSPIFDSDGFLVGMVSRIVEGDHKIYVTPINDIIKLIDYAMFHEEQMNNQ